MAVTRGRIWLVVSSLLACASCGGRGIELTLVFPGPALADATSSIELELFKQTSSSDHCAELVAELAIAETLTSVQRRMVAFPFARGELQLELGAGPHAILVSGWNRASKRERFLRGCVLLAAGASGSSLSVNLAELRGCCRADDSRCTPTASISCYDAPSHTAGKGPCSKGTASCGADSLFRSCSGQVLPSPERCNGVDDDCDGVVDDGCAGAGADAGTPRDRGADGRQDLEK